MWEEGSKDGKRGKKVGILCMRYNWMGGNELLFVVEGGEGSIGDYIWRECKKGSMWIFRWVKLYMLLGSDILENID